MTLLLSSFVLTVFAGVCPTAGTADTRSLVRSLGMPGTDNFAIVRCLSVEPHAAAVELVAHLKVIEARVLMPQRPDIPKNTVIWTLRALQYITGGLRFTASTNQKFGTSSEELRRAHLLQVYSGDRARLTFYATWMSRETTYIAPRDTQATVIKQWQQWLDEASLLHSYAPAKTLEDWYF